MRQTKLSGLQEPSLPREQRSETIAYSDIVSKGMFPDTNLSKIPDDGLSLAKNAIIRDGKTSRAPGTTLFSIIRPDGNKVLHLSNFSDRSGSVRLLRHTNSSLHYATASSWNLVTITPALSGSSSDPIRSTIADYRYFFTNNGKDQIQEVNFGTNTCGPLSANAPKAKRIFGFNNRIIGINVTTGPAPYTVNDPTLVVWSGESNYGQFDYSIDISAGFKKLVETPSDTSDFLVDGLGFDSVGLLVRQRSIWVISPQPIATDPFQCYPAIPNRGCSCEYGVAKLDNGIVFPDLQSKDVHIITVDDTINNRQSFRMESIGSPIKRHLFRNITDPTLVFSDYNAIEKEVSISIDDPASNITKQWTYSFVAPGWTYREYEMVSCISNAISLTTGKTIDELSGTIDSLPGTIDSLSAVSLISTNRILGRSDGDIVIIKDDTISDYVTGILPANFEEDLRSKLIDIPSEDIDVSCSYFPIKAYTPGTINIYYSRDGGSNWVFSKAHPITLGDCFKRYLMKFKKVVHTDSLMWRITSTDVKFDLLGYEIEGSLGGEQK